MQHLFKVGLSALVTSAALMTACGETGVERADPAQDRAADPGTGDGAPATASSGESGEGDDALCDEVATEGSAAEDGAAEDGATEEVGSAPQALGKDCSVVCTVQNLGSGVCPPTVAGYFKTALGGCRRACRKAEQDAMSKLPPGCAIYSCDRAC